MIFEVEAKKSCDNCVFCSEGIYCNLRDGDHIKFKEKDYICTFEVEESFCPLISPIPITKKVRVIPITKKVRVIEYPETMEITVKLKLDSPPYKLTVEEIETDIRMSENVIGWNYDYKIESVNINSKETTIKND